MRLFWKRKPDIGWSDSAKPVLTNLRSFTSDIKKGLDLSQVNSDRLTATATRFRELADDLEKLPAPASDALQNTRAMLVNKLRRAEKQSSDQASMMVGGANPTAERTGEIINEILLAVSYIDVDLDALFDGLGDIDLTV